MEVNPYAPTTQSPASNQLSSLEQLLEEHDASRSEYMVHESKIKTIGLVCLITTPLFLLWIIMGFRHVYQVTHSHGYAPMLAIVVFGPFCTIHMYTGYCLWRLQYRGRPLAAIGMAGFPMVTLLSIYCARALLSKKTKIIFSPEYQQVIATASLVNDLRSSSYANHGQANAHENRL